MRLKVQNGSDDHPDPQQLTEVDEELHGSIARASRKRRLIMNLDRMNRLIRPFRLLTLTRPDIAVRQKGEHLVLIDALFARDLAAAREILRNTSSLERSPFSPRWSRDTCYSGASLHESGLIYPVGWGPKCA